MFRIADYKLASQFLAFSAEIEESLIFVRETALSHRTIVERLDQAVRVSWLCNAFNEENIAETIEFTDINDRHIIFDCNYWYCEVEILTQQALKLVRTFKTEFNPDAAESLNSSFLLII